MTKDKVSQLITIAKTRHAELAKIEREKTEAAQSAWLATLGDKAQPFVEQLFNKIEKGVEQGCLEYNISGLPINDFKLEGRDVFADTISEKVIQILKEHGLEAFPTFNLSENVLKVFL